MSYVQQKRQRHHQQLQCIWLACIKVCTHEGINFSFSVYTRGPARRVAYNAYTTDLLQGLFHVFFLLITHKTTSTTWESSLRDRPFQLKPVWRHGKSRRDWRFFFLTKIGSSHEETCHFVYGNLKVGRNAHTESVLTCRRCPRNI